MDRVFVVGDSHAIALAEGANRLGLTTGMAYLSGNDWHAGVVRFHRRLGLVAAGRPGFQKRMREAAEHLGATSLLDGDHTIILSVGYQLGRLLPPIGRNGHGFAGISDKEPVISTGFVTATVLAKRASQVDLVRKLARRRPVTVVAPPVLNANPEESFVRDAIGDALRQAGADVFDGRDHFPNTGVLSDDHRHEDGVHANASYGSLVLGKTLERALAVK